MDYRARIKDAIERIDAKAFDLNSVISDLQAQRERLLGSLTVLDDMDLIFGCEADTQSPAPLVEAASDGPPPIEAAEPMARETQTDEPVPFSPDPQMSGAPISDDGGAGSSGPRLKKKVAALHAEHPEYTVAEAANALGCLIRSVRACSELIGIEWQAARPRQKHEPGSPTLWDKVVVMHRMHPTWTAAMIAKELGASHDSVRTYLRGARKDPPEPPVLMKQREFNSEAELQAHYASVKQRMGIA